MYRSSLVLSLCLTIHAASLQDRNAVTLINNNQIYNENTNFYKFNFETSNGIKREEQGSLNAVGNGEKELYVTGSYTFQSPEGKVFTVNYSAGKGGYRLMVPTTGVSYTVAAAPPTVGIDSKLLCSLCGG